MISDINEKLLDACMFSSHSRLYIVSKGRLITILNKYYLEDPITVAELNTIHGNIFRGLKGDYINPPTTKKLTFKYNPYLVLFVLECIRAWNDPATKLFIKLETSQRMNLGYLHAQNSHKR